MNDYDQHVLKDALGVSASLVDDAAKLNSLDEFSEELKQLELELRESADWLTFWEDSNGVHYEWGLAGPGVGDCSIRMTGLLDAGNDYDPAEARLECVQGRKWKEVAPENSNAHLDVARTALGPLYFAVEDWKNGELP